MREVNVFHDAEAAHQIIAQHRAVGHLRLADDILRPRLVKKKVVNDAGPPSRHSMFATETGVAHEGVSAAVKVTCIGVDAEVILLLKKSADVF